jgi:hypothetical protein
MLNARPLAMLEQGRYLSVKSGGEVIKISSACRRLFGNFIGIYVTV